MSVHKCPVCEGRGQVPAGFYYQNAAPTVVNTAPETCKSCNGKGVIFEYDGNDYNNPYTPHPYDFKYESLVAVNSCSNCGNNDGMVYTSNPPKWKCTLDNEWHTGSYCCDCWIQQQLFNGIPIKDCTEIHHVTLGLDLVSKGDVEFVNRTEQSNTID